MKIKNLLLILSFSLLLSVSAAYSVNITEEELISDRDAEMLEIPIGSQIRVIQLQKSLDLHLNKASTIVLTIETLDDTSNVDLVRLNEILQEMEAMKFDLENYYIEDDHATLVRDFLSYKADIIDLTKEFRSLVGEGLTQSQRQEVAQSLQGQINRAEIVQEYNKKIRDLTREYNRQKLIQKLEEYGIENSQIENRSSQNNLSANEIRQAMLREYRSISEDRREEVRERVTSSIQNRKENFTQRFEGRNVDIQTIRQNTRDRIQDRIDLNGARVEYKVNERREALLERNQRLKERIEARNQRLRDRAEERLNETRENVQQRVNETRENRQERLNETRGDNRVNIGVGDSVIDDSSFIGNDSSVEMENNNSQMEAEQWN